MRAFRVNGGGVVGRTIGEIEPRAAGFLTVERVRHDNVIAAAALETKIASNDVLALFGRREQVLLTGRELGDEVADMDLLDIPLQTLDIVVTNKQWHGRTIRELGHNSRGVRLKKLIRMGQEVSFFLDTQVYRGDTLQIIGTPENVKIAAKHAGYAERPTPDADLTWLAAGIVLGVLLGIPALIFK